MRRRAALGFWLLFAGLACSTTKPWQREILAKPAMKLETVDSLDTLHGHLVGIREGAMGGLDGGGGGCGCN